MLGYSSLIGLTSQGTRGNVPDWCFQLQITFLQALNALRAEQSLIHYSHQLMAFQTHDHPILILFPLVQPHNI
jgi:hypothetical protein